MRRLSYLLLVVFISSACSNEMIGPEPQLGAESPDPDIEAAPLTDPGFVCNEDSGTWVTLHGEDFSPLVVDTIATESEPDVELPTVTLTLTMDPTGGATDEAFGITLESLRGDDAGAIRWIDSNTIEFHIDQDLELPPGVYDILVTNPNGSTSTKTEAFGVLPRPTLTASTPQMTCVAQGERELVLEGDNLLVLGEEYPAVTIDGQQFEVLGVENCRELHPAFGDHQLCEEATVRIDEASMEEGVYPVTIENLDPAGCANLPEQDQVTLTITAPPVVSAISPTPVCGEQLAYEEVHVEGEGFVVLRGEEETAYPEVRIGDQTYSAFEADGCEPVEDAPAMGAERCTRLTISVGADDLAGSLGAEALSAHPDVVVENPEPVGCHSTENLSLTVVPPPMIASISPDPICTAQFENILTVEGRGFLTIGDEEPRVRVDNELYDVDAIEGCTAIENDGPETFSCERITITLAAGDVPDPARTNITVINPATAACESTDDAAVHVVAPPMVSDIQPHPLCTDQVTRTVEITGEGFLDIDGALPTVTIGTEEVTALELADCEALPLDDEERVVQTCTTLFAEIEAGALEADFHDVIVTNPESAACTSEQEVRVETVPPPMITSIQPRAICTNAATTTFDVEGENLFEIDGTGPTIVLDGVDYATLAGGCTDVEGAAGVRLCSSLEFDVDPTQVSNDVHSLVAINPEPIGCQSEPSDPIVLAGPPQIVLTDPGSICENEPLAEDMTIFGQFIYDPESGFPTVMMDNQTVVVDGLGDCETTDLGDIVLETCTELYTTVPQALRDETFDITVTGADPVACGEDTISITRQDRATVTSVIPERICQEGGSLQVQGTNMTQDAQFFLDDIPALSATISADGTSATVIFEGPLNPPEQTFAVYNPGQCGSTYETEITIDRAPLPFYVDPPATFDGITTQVTIYSAGLGGGSIQDVELVHPDGTITSLEYQIDPERPFIVQAIIPEGMLEPGEDSVDFGVQITGDFGCKTLGEGLLTITSELTVAVEAIEPPFGAQDVSTGVVITATDPVDPATNEVQFQSTPQVYLNPTDAGPDTLAREIRSIQFLDETELQGIVPSGLELGVYDVIVVNPDGSVGLLEAAFTVTEERPPLIDSVAPGSWPNDQAALEVTIEGENFRNQPIVDVFCRPSGSDETDESQLTQPNSITVDFVDDGEVFLLVDTRNLERLSVCYLRLTNPDGTYAEYSPITVTNPAQKFLEFQAGTSFDTPRRGPASFSSAPSRTARFIYVIGGDDGDEANAYPSGEFAALDRFGAPRTWRYLPFDLPTGRTFSQGIRVNDFLYLIGGSDEGTPTDEVLRAHVLDPLHTPEIVSVDLDFDEEDVLAGGGDSGLDAGVYYYRVSAVYTDDDPANPGGESLASEPQPLRLPLDGFEVTIFWEPPEIINQDIEEYRIYRSVNPDDAYGDESYLATVDADTFSFTDDGSVDPVAGDLALRLGSLGQWVNIASLNTPRQKAGITWSPNPDNPAQTYFYAIGGEDENAALADYEFLTVDEIGPRQQTITALATVGQSGGDEMLLPSPRTELAAVLAYERNASVLTGVAPHIFLLGGDSETTDNTNIKVTTIGPDGHLEPWTTFGQNRRLSGGSRMGHAAGAISGQLVYMGGAGGNPSDGGFHTDILCDTDGACPPATIPSNFESLSALNMEPRVWMGYVPFRGFFYLMGGLTTGDVPTNTVDYSVAGGTP